MSSTGGKEKKKMEIFQAALRMTNMYWDVCEFSGCLPLMRYLNPRDLLLEGEIICRTDFDLHYSASTLLGFTSTATPSYNPLRR
jgi:hypothetical protein